MNLPDASASDLDVLSEAIGGRISGAATLESAAQAFVDLAYERFESSVVLMRMFGTVPMGDLPRSVRASVHRLAEVKAVSDLVTNSTPVLSLLATRGVESAWNDRRNSQGHAGIPLASSEFVGEAPMIARLLGDIGVAFPTTERRTNFVTSAFANVNGVFYVPDARRTLDERERLVIPAQEFVDRYGVRTVFGFGGSYLSRSMFVAVIVFTRVDMMRAPVMRWLPLLSSFKAATTRLVNRGLIFDQATM